MVLSVGEEQASCVHLDPQSVSKWPCHEVPNGKCATFRGLLKTVKQFGVQRETKNKDQRETATRRMYPLRLTTTNTGMRQTGYKQQEKTSYDLVYADRLFSLTKLDKDIEAAEMKPPAYDAKGEALAVLISCRTCQYYSNSVDLYNGYEAGETLDKVSKQVQKGPSRLPLTSDEQRLEAPTEPVLYSNTNVKKFKVKTKPKIRPYVKGKTNQRVKLEETLHPDPLMSEPQRGNQPDFCADDAANLPSKHGMDNDELPPMDLECFLTEVKGALFLGSITTTARDPRGVGIIWQAAAETKNLTDELPSLPANFRVVDDKLNRFGVTSAQPKHF